MKNTDGFRYTIGFTFGVTSGIITLYIQLWLLKFDNHFTIAGRVPQKGNFSKMATATFLTYDRSLPTKSSSMSISVADAILDATVQALADAVDAVILGTNVKASVTVPNVVDAGTPGPSANVLADRGNKWLFRTNVPLDNQGAGVIYQNEIGTADNAQLPSSDNDFLDLTAGVGLALKTAWDAAYVSAQGNPGTLLSVQQVNRAAN